MKRRCSVFACIAAMVAALTSRVETEPAVVSSLAWIFDGPVNASTRIGDTLYVGGEFTSVAPSSSAAGNVYTVSSATGDVLPSPVFPFVDGTPMTVISDGAAGYYVGGAFEAAGGTAAVNLVHVLPNGLPDPSFVPQGINGAVTGLALAGDRLYLVGLFSTVGGQPRVGAAQVHAATGLVTSWSLTVQGFFPRAIEVVGSRLIVGGGGGAGVPHLLAFDAATGASSWQSRLSAAGATVTDMVAVSGRLFVAGGTFTSPLVDGVVAVDPNTGESDSTWTLPGACVGASRLASWGSVLYVAGSFSTCGGASRKGYAALNTAMAAVLPWNPTPPVLSNVWDMTALPNGTLVVAGGTMQGGSTATAQRQALVQIDAGGAVQPWTASVSSEEVRALLLGPGDAIIAAGRPIVGAGGTSRRNLAAFDLRAGTLLPWAPSTDQRVFALESSRSTVFVGGDFTLVNGQRRTSLAAVDTSGVLLPWAPAAAGLVRQLSWHPSGIYALGTFTTPSGLWHLARFSEATGALDPSWRTGATQAVAGLLTDDAYYFSGTLEGSGTSRDTVMAFDLVSGARLPWRPAVDVGIPTSSGRPLAMASDGDTVYLTGVFSNINGVARNNLAAVDRRTGAVVGFDHGRARVIGGNGVAVADGRVVHITSGGAGNGGDVTMFTSFDSTGSLLPWDPRYGHYLLSRGATGVAIRGDALVATGMFGTMGPPALQGLAVFPLDGARGPTGLRRELSGPETVLRWNPRSTPPPGGYVIEAGAAPGAPTFTLPVGQVTSVSVVVPPADYFVRVRSVDPATGASEVSNEIQISGRCVGPPPPPTRLSVLLQGPDRNTARFSWRAPDTLVSAYTLVAGSGPGLADLATFTLAGASHEFLATSAIPPGTYFVRVRATNACGDSVFTPDLRVTIGSGTDVPLAPVGVTASASGGTVTLSWTPPGAVSGYVLEAGSGIGLADLATVTLGATPAVSVPGVPPGVYLVRVRAMNAAGLGPPSAEVVVRVP